MAAAFKFRTGTGLVTDAFATRRADMTVIVSRNEALACTESAEALKMAGASSTLQSNACAPPAWPNKKQGENRQHGSHLGGWCKHGGKSL